MNKEIGVVVVTYNNEKTIEATLRSLLAQRISDIVVVDNASTDNTVKRIQSARTIKNTENRGFAVAANQGANNLTNPYILFLNPDAELKSSLISALEMFAQDSKLAIVGLLLENTLGKPELFSYGLEPTLGHMITRKFISSVARQPQWVSAGAVIVRRTAWEELKGFDERFFMYWEDVDLCRRAHERNWKIALAPTIQVKHIRGVSHKDLLQKTAIYDSSADRYFKKHYPWYIWGMQHFWRKIYRLLYPQAY